MEEEAKIYFLVKKEERNFLREKYLCVVHTAVCKGQTRGHMRDISTRAVDAKSVETEAFVHLRC